ncbi:MAG: tetratricopeptide repeat protein [Acidobacteria bacterium]|nr:tetratricopeptide repeat protein [Acidobacteriota bacterium]
MNPLKLSALCFLLLLAFFSAAAQTDADAVRQSVAAAQNQLKSGDAAGALKTLQTALQTAPDSRELKFWLGKTYYLQGDYKNAVEILTPLADKFPAASAEQSQLVQMLGLAHYITGRLAEAIPYFEKILLAQPDNGEVAYALGVSYIQTRQPAKSREVFAKLFKVTTNSAAAYLLNAKMHVRQQFEETAELELNRALELDPKLPEVRFVLGELAIYRAEIDKGVEFLRQEIALNPADSMAYYRLGEGLSRQLKWDEAIPPLQRSIWLNPFFSGPYIVLGKVYLKKQDLGNAESMLRRATSIDPKNFGAHYLLAQVLQQAGKADDAKAEFAVAEKLRGNADKEP